MTDLKVLDELALTKRGSSRYGVLLRQAADSLIADSRRLRTAIAALREVQWCSDVIDPDGDALNLVIYHLCPLCDQSKVRGHAPDCLVGMALEGCGEGEAK